MNLTYAPKSFSPFLRSRRRAGVSLSERQRRKTIASRRLLNDLAQEGPSQVSALYDRSGMDPIAFAATLQSMKDAGLISMKRAKGGQLVHLTPLGQEMMAEVDYSEVGRRCRSSASSSSAAL